jgi:hypothetical protein
VLPFLLWKFAKANLYRDGECVEQTHITSLFSVVTCWYTILDSITIIRLTIVEPSTSSKAERKNNTKKNDTHITLRSWVSRILKIILGKCSILVVELKNIMHDNIIQSGTARLLPWWIWSDPVWLQNIVLLCCTASLYYFTIENVW